MAERDESTSKSTLPPTSNTDEVASPERREFFRSVIQASYAAPTVATVMFASLRSQPFSPGSKGMGMGMGKGEAKGQN